MPRFFQFFQQRRKRLLPVRQHPGAAGHGKRRAGQPLRQLQQPLLARAELRQIPGQQMAVKVDPFIAKLVLLGLFIELAPFEIVLSQQKIKQQPHYRQQGQHQNPGHRTGRIPVFHKYRQTDCDDRERLKYTDQRTPEFPEDAKSEIVKSKKNRHDNNDLKSPSHASTPFFLSNDAASILHEACFSSY